MAPAGTLLLFLCTASALLRPALLSSGTDVSFLDRTLLEKDIAAVFNKVSFIFHCCSLKISEFIGQYKCVCGKNPREGAVSKIFYHPLDWSYKIHVYCWTVFAY
jgi:hypothetical protein